MMKGAVWKMTSFKYDSFCKIKGSQVREREREKRVERTYDGKKQRHSVVMS